MIKFVLILAILALFSNGKSQQIPLPLNVRNAISKGTRTNSGSPGIHYWQNHSDYKINVEVHPDSSILFGREYITYFNESPDTLKQLVFRIYPNLFKKGNPRQFGINPSDINKGIILDSIKIENSSIDPATDPVVKVNYTNLVLNLKTPLLPKANITVYFKWSCQIPKFSNVRMGKYKNGSMLIAYFYPQIAVYDDIDGWDMSEYFGVAEFYNDFSNFSVTIKAPQDYIVWGNGTSLNYPDIFKDSIIRKLNLSKSTDTLLNLSGPGFKANQIFKNDSSWHTWKFKASDINEFTFAMSDNYIWDATSILLDSPPQQRCQIFSLYPLGAPYYEKVTKFAKATLTFLSNCIPGIVYPYPQVTIFCNGSENGGMEFPMMVNDGAPKNLANSVGLTFHEISHSYFPFYMGINERKYAWMDEGWATMLPYKVISIFDSTYDYESSVVNNYLAVAGTEYDTPPAILSTMINPPSYRNASYSRPAVAYYMLKDLLGEKEFKDGMQTYIRTWNGKHPLPMDFFNIFDKIAGENLNWFWRPWFYDIDYPDLQISNVKFQGSNVIIQILNKGGIPLPVNLKMTFADGSEKIYYWTCKIWKDESLEHRFNIKSKVPPVLITIGNNHIPDIDLSNNNFYVR